jgi:hypothetical protein
MKRLDLTDIPYLRIGPNPAPKTVCPILEYQMMDKSRHHFQNPSELTFGLLI